MFIYIPDFVQSFFDTLDLNVRAKLLELFEIVELGDYVELMSHSKKIEDGIYELRIKSILHARIFFTFRDRQMFVLHAIIKKTWKIPSKELDIVRRRLKLLQSI